MRGSRRRANSGGKAVVTSDESGSVDREVGHVVQKDPFGELISNWLVTVLGSLLAMCVWTVYSGDCLRPKRDSSHGNTERELARTSPGPSRWCPRYEALARWEERLLLWKVRDEEWVVTAPDGRVYVEELPSLVGAQVTFGRVRPPGCWRRVAVQPGADEASREPSSGHRPSGSRGELSGKDHERFFDAFGAPMTVTFEHGERFLREFVNVSLARSLDKSRQPSFRCMAPKNQNPIPAGGKVAGVLSSMQNRLAMVLPLALGFRARCLALASRWRPGADPSSAEAALPTLLGGMPVYGGDCPSNALVPFNSDHVSVPVDLDDALDRARTSASESTFSGG